jgi:LAO/AO transport system kinase
LRARGGPGALARAITAVDATPESAALLDASFTLATNACRLGVTGPPGAGKHLVTPRAGMAAPGAHRRDRRRRSTSLFSGGALLGDRVRMGELAGDPGVFIRSMASRGSLGGVAVHTSQVCDVLDAAGFDRILVETAGRGQSESRSHRRRRHGGGARARIPTACRR